MPTLFLLTGPWASGKTSVADRLGAFLPAVTIFDWDLIIPGLSAASGKDVHVDSSTWPGLQQTWKAIVRASLGQRDVLLCCPPLSGEFALDLGAGVTVRHAYLDCPDDVLVERLRERGASEAEIADELSVASSLRESAGQRIAVDNGNPAVVAEEVASWVDSPG